MTSRDDFTDTVRAAATGLLSEGALSAIIQAADTYRASALAEFAEELHLMAFDACEAGRARGFWRAFRASIGAGYLEIAAKTARERAGQPEAATAGTSGDQDAASWAEPRTDEYSPAHARTSP